MMRKPESWITLTFLALVAIQAVLVVVQRTGPTLPDRVFGGVRLVVAILILAILAFWAVQEWRGRSSRGGG
jgi:hypothetical protein